MHIPLPERPQPPLFLPKSHEKVIHAAEQEHSQLGQEGNIGIAFHALPFGDRLRRNAEQFPEFLLRQMVFAAVFPDLFRNNDSFHITVTKRSPSLVP